MNKKLSRIAAIIVFAGVIAGAIGNTVGMLGESMWALMGGISMAAFVLCAAGLLLASRKLFGIGAIAAAVMQLVTVGLNVMVLVSMGAGALNVVNICVLVFFVLVVLICFVKALRGSKVAAIIAALIAVGLIVEAVVTLMGNMPFAVSVESVPYYVLTAAYAILVYAGLALGTFAVKPAESPACTSLRVQRTPGLSEVNP